MEKAEDGPSTLLFGLRVEAYGLSKPASPPTILEQARRFRSATTTSTRRRSPPRAPPRGLP